MAKRYTGPTSGGYKALFHAVEDACCFGIKHHEKMWYHSKSNQIVRLIFKAIANGLRKDGKVVIEGLGRFFVEYDSKLRPAVRFRTARRLYHSFDDPVETTDGHNSQA